MNANRTPVLVLTGFLGSGKTTILNHWLRQPALANAAVIVNEFGEVGIDHVLIASSDDRTIELTTGCICCAAHGALVETLQNLIIRRDQGDIHPFDSVVIETTGIVDPVPVVHVLMSAPVSTGYELSRIITAVEAPQGLQTAARYVEARKQIMVANDILLTKIDLAQDAVDDIERRLAEMNPAARIYRSNPDHIPFPLTETIRELGTQTAQHGAAWLRADHIHNHNHHHHHQHDDSPIGTFVLSFDEPLKWQDVAAWLDALVIAHSAQILRIKGILDIDGHAQPIVIQTVQGLFHPPTALDAWPAGNRQSQIVFITDGIRADFVRQVLDVIRQKPCKERAA